MVERPKKSASVVVPFSEPFERDLLDLTLFSLIGQNEVSLEIIVLVSGGESKRKEVYEIIERQSIEPSIKNQLRIQCVDSYGLEAWRLAWNLARNRYFCVLEANSVLYLNALSTLIDEVQVNSQAFAFAAEKRSFYNRTEQSTAFHIYEKPLVCNEDNYLSIFYEKNISLSSCLIDRDKANSSIFNRDTNQSISDSYQLLLNLFGTYPIASTLRKVPLSERYFDNREKLTQLEKLEITQLKSNRISVSIAEVHQIFLEIHRLREESGSFWVRVARKIGRVLLRFNKIKKLVVFLLTPDKRCNNKV